MIEHFGIYANSGDVQTALNEEALVKPYVAKVGSDIDYNTLSINGVYVVDSDGNKYQPISEDENEWDFRFEMDINATWTLYRDGNVVTAKTGSISWYYTPQGIRFDSVSFSNTPVANIHPSVTPSYDTPIQEITISYNIVSGNHVIGNTMITYNGR